ncbi:hypothetical protein [Roseovarius aestuariivivens]|uniref:hypothetical protein n=1 Tax=Roseovarius aestuariivivens TaxID=1888910 RepID=UPI0010819C10|nr:hypothetical protein [Roseovarius aestuariivivens]
MNHELTRKRRLLLVTYKRYLEADLGWSRASSAARAWFPDESRPYRGTMGSPRSPLRRIYEKRQRALLQLAAARAKFREAKAQMEARRTMILCLPAPRDGSA